jgi:hypothetical protein
MITEYFICSATSKETLAEVVNAAIVRGWQPIGGVAVSVNIEWSKGKHGTDIGEAHEYYCQAVVMISDI